MTKAKKEETAVKPEAEIEGVTHVAYEALKAAKIASPWSDHSDLEKAARIERITNRQKVEAHRRKVTKDADRPVDLTQKQLDAAKAHLTRLETQLHEQEAEKSKLAAQKRNSTSAEYITKITDTLDVLKDLIARTSRELRQVKKQVARAEQRLEEERAIKERMKSQYIVLKTAAEREIQARVQEQRQRKLSQIMRQTDGPLIALAQQQDALAERIAVEFGPEVLRQLNAQIEHMNTR
jgi:hypothetical protein